MKRSSPWAEPACTPGRARCAGRTSPAAGRRLACLEQGIVSRRCEGAPGRIRRTRVASPAIALPRPGATAGDLVSIAQARRIDRRVVSVCRGWRRRGSMRGRGRRRAASAERPEKRAHRGRRRVQVISSQAGGSRLTGDPDPRALRSRGRQRARPGVQWLGSRDGGRPAASRSTWDRSQWSGRRADRAPGSADQD
jgi:hypothetical protein